MGVHPQQEGMGLCTGASRVQKGVCFRRGGHCSPQARHTDHRHMPRGWHPSFGHTTPPQLTSKSSDTCPLDTQPLRNTTLGLTTPPTHPALQAHTPRIHTLRTHWHPVDTQLLGLTILGRTPLRHRTCEAQQHTQTSKCSPDHI